MFTERQGEYSRSKLINKEKVNNQPEAIRGLGGRPKRRFTDEEVQQIEQHARNNCYNRTISTALDIPIHTLERRFGTKIRKWRAQGKVELRQLQRNLAKTSAQMAKFLGQNELDQTDRQEIFQTGDGLSINITEAKPNVEVQPHVVKLRKEA